MTLSDAEEILPLLKSGQVKINQGKKKVIKKNLVNGKKKTVKSFPISNSEKLSLEAGIEQYENRLKNYGSQSYDFQAKFKKQTQNEFGSSITYSWSNLNVYGTSSLRKTKPFWKRIMSCTKKNDKPLEEYKHILKNAYGIACPGEILAIMGSSGAGKTTLLNALNFQQESNTIVKGFRYLNGRLATSKRDVIRSSAYVEQDTLFLGTLTVQEHLIFQALVRMDRNMSYRFKIERVEEVIQELGLEKCRNTIIGSPGKIKGISGGEMRRLSLASEVLINPSLMFCDEPTSGLDSFIALNVIKVLKSMSHKNKTIICTIHQPSSEIFSLFDKVLLLANGRTAFLGAPEDASKFFTELGASPLVHYNSAEFFIQMLSIVPNQKETSKQTIEFICDCFDESPYGVKLYSDIENSPKTQFLDSELYNSNSSYNGNNLKYNATWCTQFRALLWRSWLNVIKEPLLFKVRIFQTVVLSFVVGLIYQNQKMDENGVMNINGVLFTFLTNMTFQNLFSVVSVFCTELAVFTKEYSKKLYRVDAYFLSKTLVEVPVFIIIPLIFIGITYFWIGLNPGFKHFFTAALIIILVTNAAVSFGYFISCISKNSVMALSLGPPIVVPFLLFGGFLLNSKVIPPYFKGLSYLSWFKFGNEALLINQWSDVEYIECSSDNSTCPKNGQIVLQIFGFHEENFSLDIAALCILILFFRFIAFLVLLLRTWRRQNYTNNKDYVDLMP